MPLARRSAPFFIPTPFRCFPLQGEGGGCTGSPVLGVVLPERVGGWRAGRHRRGQSGHPGLLCLSLGMLYPHPSVRSTVAGEPADCLFPPRSSGPFSPLHPHPPALPHDFAFCNIVSHFGSWAPQGEGRNGRGRVVVEMDVCVCVDEFLLPRRCSGGMSRRISRTASGALGLRQNV